MKYKEKKLYVQPYNLWERLSQTITFLEKK
jgi:hypothetical protein